MQYNKTSISTWKYKYYLTEKNNSTKKCYEVLVLEYNAIKLESPHSLDFFLLQQRKATQVKVVVCK